MVERHQLAAAIDFINATAYANDPEGLILADRLAEHGHLIARLYHAAITILRSRMDQLGGETETHVEVIRDALIHLKEHGTI